MVPRGATYRRYSAPITSFPSSAPSGPTAWPSPGTSRAPSPRSTSTPRRGRSSTRWQAPARCSSAARTTTPFDVSRGGLARQPGPVQVRHGEVRQHGQRGAGPGGPHHLLRPDGEGARALRPSPAGRWDGLRAHFLEHLDEVNADLAKAGLPQLAERVRVHVGEGNLPEVEQGLY